MRWARRSCVAAVSAVALSAAVGSAWGSAEPGTSPARSCASLLAVPVPNATVDSAVEHPGDASTPASCRVHLSVTHPPAGDDVNIWIHMPLEGWNGRFQGVGGGGFSAGSEEDLADAVREGYAAGATDGGHEGGDPSFALDADNTLNWQRIQDFAYLGIHEMTVTGKAIAQAFYGTPARYAYFNGCSTGGRQGLMEAQRYPDDYDGILAGAPAINWTRFQTAQFWGQTVMHVEGNPVAMCKFEAAVAAAVAACDQLGDGVRDGVIGDPLACRFDPQPLVGTATPCGEITQADVDVMRRIWEGARRRDGGFLWYGLPHGAPFSGLHDTELVDGELVQRPFEFDLAWIGLWLEQDPDWDWRTITYAGFEEYFEQSVEMYGDVLSTEDPDLRAFERSGGKILMWHGLADWGIFPQGTIDYFERVVDVVGSEQRAERFIRLFLAPGVEHCGGGPGPQPTGQLDALVDWVERGRAPETLEGVRRDEAGAVVASRPICRYPRVARYRGSGDTAAASSYRCAKATRMPPEPR